MVCYLWTFSVADNRQWLSIDGPVFCDFPLFPKTAALLRTTSTIHEMIFVKFGHFLTLLVLSNLISVVCLTFAVSCFCLGPLGLSAWLWKFIYRARYSFVGLKYLNSQIFNFLGAHFVLLFTEVKAGNQIHSLSGVTFTLVNLVVTSDLVLQIWFWKKRKVETQ